MSTKSAAVKAAEKNRDTDVTTLKNGLRIRVSAVSDLLVEKALNEVPVPKPPMVTDEDRGGIMVENPNDPRYLQEMEAYQRKLGEATIDAAILWGIELLDDMPDDSKWLHQLRYYAKRGHFNLDGYDLEDEFEKKFLFLRYFGLDSETIADLMPKIVSRMSEEEIEAARESFRSDER